MHINYGDKSLIIRQIQTIIRKNHNRSIVLSGEYDTTTHNNLLSYLRLPTIATRQEIQEYLNNTYDIESIFTCNLYPDYIEYISDKIYPETDIEKIENFLDTRNYPNNIYNMSDVLKTLGWAIDNYTNLLYGDNYREYKIILKPDSRLIQYPDEITPMLNMFDNQYMYNVSFGLDTITRPDQMTYNPNLGPDITIEFKRIAIVPCKPNDTISILTGYNFTDDTEKYKVYLSNSYSDRNAVGRTSEGDGVLVFNNKEVNLDKNNPYYVYKVSEGDNNLYTLIELPYITVTGTLVDNELTDIITSVSDTSSLLVILGDIREYEDNDKELYDYLVTEFRSNPWIVHEDMIQYLLGTAITSFGKSSDIVYLQKLLNSSHSTNIENSLGKYTDEMKGIVSDIQKSNNINISSLDETLIKNRTTFITGYLDNKTERELLTRLVMEETEGDLYGFQ